LKERLLRYLKKNSLDAATNFPAFGFTNAALIKMKPLNQRRLMKTWCELKK